MLKSLFSSIAEAFFSTLRGVFNDYLERKERERLILLEKENQEIKQSLAEAADEKKQTEDNYSLSDSAVSDKLQSVRDKIKAKRTDGN